MRNKRQPAEKQCELLNYIIKKMSLKNDAALGRLLGFNPPIISKYRSNKLPVGSAFILATIERTAVTLSEVRAFIPQ